MYGVEWLIVMALLGLAAGLGGGYLLARKAGAGGQRLRELEEQLAAARQQYEDYRHEVVTQFSETARRFQTLNDSYTDLHRQLAKSSSILCGDVSGPLLAAPSGHQDLLPNQPRHTAGGQTPADAPPQAAAAAGTQEPEPPTLQERVEPPKRAAQAAPPESAVPEAAAADDDASPTATAPAGAPPFLTDIRVAEPADAHPPLRRPQGAAASAGASPEASAETASSPTRSAAGHG